MEHLDKFPGADAASGCRITALIFPSLLHNSSKVAQIEVKAELHVPSPINHWTSAAPERDITLDKAALFSYGNS